jgi:integrase
MPRLTHSVPSYRLHRPSGRAVVTLNGKDHYLGAWNSPQSRVQYDRLISEWVAARNAPVHSTPADKFTIAQLLLAYLKEAQVTYVKHGKETSHLHNIRDAITPLNHMYGTELIAQFGPLKLKAVRETWIKKRLCRSTINKHAGTLKRIFRWGTENEMVPPVVNEAIEAVSGLRRGRTDTKESAPVKPVPEAHVDAVKPFVTNLVWAMIELQGRTGMRPGEVVIMRGCDLDTTGKIWVYKPPSHKTEHMGFERPVYLGPRAQQTVKQFLRPELSEYLFNPREATYPRAQRKSEAGQKSPRRNKRKRATKTSRRRGRRPGTRYTSESYRRAIARPRLQRCRCAPMAPEPTASHCGDGAAKGIWYRGCAGRPWPPVLRCYRGLCGTGSRPGRGNHGASRVTRGFWDIAVSPSLSLWDWRDWGAWFGCRQNFISACGQRIILNNMHRRRFEFALTPSSN